MSTEETAVQDDAAAALSDLAVLKYQQKQLVRSGDYGAVLRQVLRQRLFLNVILALLGLLMVTTGVTSIIHNGSGFGSLTLAVCCLTSLVRRVSSERRVVRRIRQLQASIPMEERVRNSLVAELRLNHSLTWSQVQQLKEGRAVQAAADIVSSYRQDGRSALAGAILGAAITAGGYALLKPTDDADQAAPKIMMFYGGGIFLWVGLQSLWYSRKASRLMRLIATTVDNEDDQSRDPCHTFHSDPADTARNSVISDN